ncbi:hypothetical protein GONAM_15_01190 [Gordonia namibiensis NBRC 108229]|uniref:Uncharacterized protein n=1 Tax=Gordonia namibiensis NBRC 108229 TaxID=1208314 RepID=K6XNL6_9ACTN|nr:hypothetical protein GONAM_15_01190 [Gordonia namibiensis NBRC 108229]
MQRIPSHPAKCDMGFYARRDLGGRVGVHSPSTAVVSGEQVDHLAASYLADDDPVGPHEQRLPYQRAHRNLAHAFDVRRARHESHHLGWCGASSRASSTHTSRSRGSIPPISAFSRVVFTAAQLARITQDVTDRDTEIAAQMATRTGSAVAGVVGPDIRKRWPELPMETRRAVLDTLATVTVLPGAKRGRYFDPDAIEVQWKAL